MYALRILQQHGLCDVGLQEVFRTVGVSRLTYASTAWGRFVTVTNIQRVDAFLRRSKCYGYYPLDLPDSGKQLMECDYRLFNKISHNQQHFLVEGIARPNYN